MNVIGLRWLTIAAIGGIIVWKEALALLGASLDRLYYGFDTHAYAVLIGCALALFLVDPKYRSHIEKYLQKFPFIGCAALVALPVTFSLLMSCVLTAVVIADIVIRPGLTRKFLE